MVGYYAPCPEFDACNRLIQEYFQTGQYAQCFQGHLALAERGYPLAECQVGYFYYEGLGVERDLEKSFQWTRRAARRLSAASSFLLCEQRRKEAKEEKLFAAKLRFAYVLY